MAAACECDRCHRFFKVDNDGRAFVVHLGRESITEGLVKGLTETHKYHLCGSCQTKLVDWLNRYQPKPEKGDDQNGGSDKRNSLHKLSSS